MSDHRLVLCGGIHRPRGSSRDKAILLDLWGSKRNVDLKVSDISERLAANIPDLLLDLLEVAAYIYAADQAATRGGDIGRGDGINWRRRFEFHIPVRELTVWSSQTVLDALIETLGFLSEDEYEFKFYQVSNPPQVQQYFEFGPGGATGLSVESVILFSGGLDSFAGAVQEAVREKRQVILVSHRSSPKFSSHITNLVADLKNRCPNPPLHIPVWIYKDKQLGREYTQRTRSFLYASLGAVVARVFDLWGIRFYENGVVSLNLPFSEQVVGSRATRTTHPQVINGFSKLFSTLFGQAFRVDNPFLWKTKTEVVSSIKEANCGELIRHTISCTRTWQRTKLHSHCGRCSQCIDRRFAIVASECANMDPEEMYAVDLCTGAREDNLPTYDMTMLESYVRMQTEISKMHDDGAEFFSRFGEATRVLRHLEAYGTAAQVAKMIFDLYRRHASHICQVVDNLVARHSPEMREGKLPETCLIALAWDKKYRQRVHTTVKPMQKFPIPHGINWEQISMRVLDRETVSISANGHCEVRTYHGMGMINSKNGKPDTQWNLLMDIADEHGHLTWNSSHADRKNQKRKELLSKKLRQFFGLNDDPFFVESGGWKARFQIDPPS